MNEIEKEKAQKLIQYFFKTDAGKEVKQQWHNAGEKRKLLSEDIAKYKGAFEKETGIKITEKQFMDSFLLTKDKYGTMHPFDFAKIDRKEFIKDMAEYAENGRNEVKQVLYATKKKDHLASIKKLSNPMDMIQKNFITDFNALEDKITKKDFTKIKCAAFCELLREYNFFIESKHRIVTCRTFAYNQYNLDIKNALAGPKKDDRNKQKDRLEYYFKERGLPKLRV